jgi:DNA-binding XRE family transcriptional regulator
MWYNPSIMSTDFSSLIADIEQEAQDEGPLAVRELEQFREEFSLASQLIESRREGKLSQRELAKLSGVPQSEISRIETGTSNPTYATIAALLLLGAPRGPAQNGRRRDRGSPMHGSAPPRRRNLPDSQLSAT